MNSTTQPLLEKCGSCGGNNLTDARYCSQCGIRLQAVTEEDQSALSIAKRTTAGLNEASAEIDSSELPVADPLIGTIVAGRYRIIEPLGRGGMGVVYRVEHARIGKLMALKLLTGELSRDQEVVARFKREALMVSKLSHPNTVQVFDFGVSDGLTYLAMEYLRGDDLGRIVRKTGPLSPERCSRVIIQVCSSLCEAHDLGIVHRDLKPENIFILSGQPGSDVVKVLDFGLAKLRESAELGEVTSRGAIVGTPYYMSPEQIRGEAVDSRSDIYALGALMYAALTGEPVFDAPRPMGVLTKHLTDRPESPSARFPALGIPPGVSAVVMRALEKDPERRFQNVNDLQEALVNEVRRVGMSSSVDLLLDSGQMHALTRATEEAATRDEVEDYERTLRRRGLYTWFGAAGVGCAALFGVWQVFQRATATPAFDGREHEPNNSAGESNVVPFGQVVKGQIAQRLDAERSDRDFYRIDLPQGTTSVSLTTTSLPNMAVCTFAYKVGIDSPLGRYCSGRAGQDLKVPVLELPPGAYLFAVMQDRDSYEDIGIPVLENVSDSYELTLTRAEPGPGEESEPNDGQRDANEVTPGSTFRGRLGWMRDVDTLCVKGTARPVRFVVTESADGRSRHSVMQVTPIGGPASGVAVRVHHKVAGGDEHDVQSPWSSPAIDTPGDACLTLALVPNPLAAPPHPKVAPAGEQEYSVRVESIP